MTRGFVLGATAGRTTLNGEGLQHEDGHSLLLASTNPAAVSYDPAFGFEIGHIVQDGLRRMYGDRPGEHLLLPHDLQRALPAAGRAGGRRRRGHPARACTATPPRAEGDGPKAQLLASGVAVQWALEAQRLLQDDWDVQADVWSVTSWNELRRDGLAADEHNFLAPRRRAAGALRHPAAGRAPPARSSRCPTSCARCRTRSRRGCPATSRRWAPTASGCPTPAVRCAGTSRSTRSRSRCGRWASWPAAARSSAKRPRGDRPLRPRRRQRRADRRSRRRRRVAPPAAVDHVRQATSPQ